MPKRSYIQSCGELTKSFSIFPKVIALKQTNLTELLRINFINTFTQFLDKTFAIRRAISSV